MIQHLRDHLGIRSRSIQRAAANTRYNKAFGLKKLGQKRTETATCSPCAYDTNRNKLPMFSAASGEPFTYYHKTLMLDPIWRNTSKPDQRSQSTRHFPSLAQNEVERRRIAVLRRIARGALEAEYIRPERAHFGQAFQPNASFPVDTPAQDART
jgi:hypothetical protein